MDTPPEKVEETPPEKQDATSKEEAGRGSAWSCMLPLIAIGVVGSLITAGLAHSWSVGLVVLGGYGFVIMLLAVMIYLNGNTLQEVIVSSAIVLVLALILFPVFRQAREKGIDTNSLSNVKGLELYLITYAGDHNGQLPSILTTAALKDLFKPYGAKDDIFVDPHTHTDYGWNTTLAGKSLNAIDIPENVVLCYELKPGSDGKRTVGFLDGHAKRIPESQWQALNKP